MRVLFAQRFSSSQRFPAKTRVEPQALCNCDGDSISIFDDVFIRESQNRPPIGLQQRLSRTMGFAGHVVVAATKFDNELPVDPGEICDV